MNDREMALYSASLAVNHHRSGHDEYAGSGPYWAACAVISVRRGPDIQANGEPTREEISQLYKEFCEWVSKG